MKGSLGYAVPAADRTQQVKTFDAIRAHGVGAFTREDGRLTAAAWLAAELPRGSRILDVGVGTALPAARRLVEAGHTVVSVDVSTLLVEPAELAGRGVPAAGPPHGATASPMPPDLAEACQFDALTCFFSLLLLPRREIPRVLGAFHRMLRPGGLFTLAMVEGSLDDAPTPFLGHVFRVSGLLRDELRQVVRDADFEIAGEAALSYSPASTDAPPENQLFLNCRRA